MKLVSQPFHSKQCGHACIAMVTGETIQQVCEALQNPWSLKLDGDIMFYLNSKGYRTRIIYGNDLTIDEVPNDAIVMFRYINEAGHFALKKNDLFYDPSVGIVKEYKEDVKVTHWLQFQKKEID
ncbi:conserved hypothetical protein [Tenacibaculum sp. 190524A05c]|uniref:hypothetical protein n=1 Tax=Tenacibaculum platacis TaxID=3137852 RepID=UPI0031FA5350